MLIGCLCGAVSLSDPVDYRRLTVGCEQVSSKGVELAQVKKLAWAHAEGLAKQAEVDQGNQVLLGGCELGVNADRYHGGAPLLVQRCAGAGRAPNCLLLRSIECAETVYLKTSAFSYHSLCLTRVAEEQPVSAVGGKGRMSEPRLIKGLALLYCLAACRFGAASQRVGRFMQTLAAYPPGQKSFDVNIDAMMGTMYESGSR